MKRRHFNQGIAAATAWWAARGALSAPSMPQPPTEVMPYTMVANPVAEEVHTVRLFFAYKCQFCRASHRGLARWGSTLPEQLEFREGPVVTLSADGIASGMAFYAMKQLAPRRLMDFNEAVYTLVQDKGMSLADVRTFAIAAQQVGVPEARLRTAWEAETTGKIVTAAAVMAGKYQIRATPTVAVAGRMLITPELTAGVNDAFYRLANAVVSKSIIDMAGGAS